MSRIPWHRCRLQHQRLARDHRPFGSLHFFGQRTRRRLCMCGCGRKASVSWRDSLPRLCRIWNHGLKLHGIFGAESLVPFASSIWPFPSDTFVVQRHPFAQLFVESKLLASACGRPDFASFPCICAVGQDELAAFLPRKCTASAFCAGQRSLEFRGAAAFPC